MPRGYYVSRLGLCYSSRSFELLEYCQDSSLESEWTRSEGAEGAAFHPNLAQGRKPEQAKRQGLTAMHVIQAESLPPRVIRAEQVGCEEMPFDPPAVETSRRRWFTRGLAVVASGLEWLFGLFSLIVGLAVLATIPVLQLVSLGYLLEVSGRIARTGRIRDGLIGVRTAARIGSLVAGTWLVLFPLRAVSSFYYSSLLINGSTSVTRGWWWALVSLAGLTLVHLVWAWFRGGRFRHFLWPAPLRFVRRLSEGDLFQSARDRTYEFLARLRLWHYFQLGFRAFLGTMAWLIIPVTLMGMTSRWPVPWGPFASVAGSLVLAVILVYLPFLQTRFAASGNWRDLFSVRAVRRDFRHAPIAFWMALLATLALALPLYLLKAELIPREAAWLPSLVFVLFILPARLLTGWAVGRAFRREEMRHWLSRWASRLGMVPLVLIYVLVVYFTQYVSWYGTWSLYEQHAFLVPVPFLEF